ncbi:hypothetical protein [Nocardiopsis sp. LOL_012]|uniref:hypothetical protein n=1 Tax=Nocardiopsis sp. LOL_012 TaxID=3345409 RepID=UPI003A8AD3F5
MPQVPPGAPIPPPPYGQIPSGPQSPYSHPQNGPQPTADPYQDPYQRPYPTAPNDGRYPLGPGQDQGFGAPPATGEQPAAGYYPHQSGPHLPPSGPQQRFQGPTGHQSPVRPHENPFPQGPPSGPQPPMPPGPGAPGDGHPGALPRAGAFGPPSYTPHTSPQPPGGPGPDPVFPSEAQGPTQYIPALPPTPGAAADRPLYRDEVPADAGSSTTQFDVEDYDSHDDYPDRRPSGTSGGPDRTRLLLIAGFVVLLVIAGGGAFFFARGGFSGGGDGSEGSPVAPLAAESFFPETVDLGDAGTFTRVVVDETAECAEGTHNGYGQVLTDSGCEQLIRASYVSEDEARAVTIGVATLDSEADAVAAQEGQDLVAAEWFAGLAGEEGTPAQRLGSSGGHGSSGQWGSYVLFALAANSDGSAEAASAEAEAATALRSVSEGFLNETFARLTAETE